MKNRWHEALALGTAVGIASIAFATRVQSQPGDAGRDYDMGGAWVGSGAGFIWTSQSCPADPTGKRLAIQVESITYSPEFAAFVASFGADSGSSAVLTNERISRDTYQFSMLNYLLASGNPPIIRAIQIWRGTWTFTGPDTGRLDFQLEVYLPETDADLDGLPDPGTTPAVTIPNLVNTAKRLKVL